MLILNAFKVNLEIFDLYTQSKMYKCTRLINYNMV